MSPITELIGGAKVYGWASSPTVIPDTYTRLADITNGVQYHGAAVSGGKYYVVSGSNTTHMQEYDPTADTWTQKASLPGTRDALACAEVSGTIFAFGGYLTSNLNTAYSVSANTWTAKTAMPTGRSYLFAQAVGTVCYVMGGYTGSVINPGPNEAYDTVANTWSTKATFTGGRANALAVTDGTDVWFIAGSAPAGSRQTAVTKYSVSGNSYSTYTAIPVEREVGSGGYVNGKIYYIGGTENTSPYYTDTNYAYTIATDSWSQKTSVPVKLSAFTAGVIGTKIYFNTGDSAGTVSKRVYVYQT